MVPTMAWLHLRLPYMRRLVEGICLLPMAIPAVVIANGILGAFKSWPQAITGSSWILILEYVILALPFTYRSLDAGLSAIPLTTMVEAARSLGASWPTTLWRVVVPNIRTSIASAGILGAALALGEFTIANLLLLNTFPIWTDQAGQQDGEVATTASMLILFLSWLLLMLVSHLGRGRGRRSPRSPRSRTRPPSPRCPSIRKPAECPVTAAPSAPAPPRRPTSAPLRRARQAQPLLRRRRRPGRPGPDRRSRAP